MSEEVGKFLTVDPGEDTGWSIWEGHNLLDAGTTKMWEFSDSLWRAALRRILKHGQYYIEEDEFANALDGIGLIVVENWRLYPKEAHSGALDWDECRTARLIGSIFAVCRFTGWRYIQQPALIKDSAEAAGAEAYFSHPLRENRHANDAIRHAVFYLTYVGREQPRHIAEAH